VHKTDILTDLTDAQREAATHIEGPLLILAGAGSGKTRVVTRRIAWMLREGVPPDAILAITFTNKAADEMKSRVAVLTAAQGLRISTFHSFCARELRRFADRVGLTHRYSIYDTADRTRLIRDCISGLNIDPKQLKPSSVEATISRAKNEMLSPEAYARSTKDFYAQQAAKVYARYERGMRTRDALDFDDLLLRMVELLEADADARATLERQFRYVSVDEYQDTNRAQYRIVRLMTQGHANLCVTGDPDQAIYGWRGADIGNILSFERDYPGAKTVLLERNYRSTRTILAAAQGLIVHNEMRKEKTLFTENETGSRVRLLEAEDDQAEAFEVASRVRALITGGTPPHDVAVFYRVNALSRPFELALRRVEVPYRVVAGVAFFERREVRDLLAYLRLVANPRDDLACERIVNVPARGIGKTSVEHAKTHARENGLSLFEALGRAGEVAALAATAPARIEAFVGLIGEVASLAHQGPAALLDAVAERTGYLKTFGKSEEDRDRLRNVEELTNAAADYEEHTEEPSLLGFLEEVALVSDQDGLDDKSPTVSLMTLHAAKGLEFPHVFIVGLEDGTLPHERSRNSQAEMEEERRLLYVGMTRAKRELTVSFALCRRRFGTYEYGEPSRFLREIPREHVETIEAAASPEPMTRRTTHRAGPAGSPALPADKTMGLGVGDTVRHPLYGVGKVEAVSGMGEKTKVDVHFGTVGLKTLMAAHAKLEKLVSP